MGKNYFCQKDSPFRLIQMAVKAKQFAYGDWNDLLNPDYLSKMVLSLPGMAYYDAIMPWV